MKKILNSVCILAAITICLMSCGYSTSYDLRLTISNTTNEDLHFCISDEIDDPESDFVLVTSKDRHTFSKKVVVQTQSIDYVKNPVDLFLLTKEYEDSLCKLVSIVNQEDNTLFFSVYVIDLKKVYTKEEFEQIISNLPPEDSDALLELYYLQDEYYSFQDSFFANLTNDQIELEIAYYNNISLKISEEIQKTVFVVQN